MCYLYGKNTTCYTCWTICILTSSTCSLSCLILSDLSLQAAFRAQFRWFVVTWLLVASKSNMASQLRWRVQNSMYFIESCSCKLFIFSEYLNDARRIKWFWWNITILSLNCATKTANLTIISVFTASGCDKRCIFGDLKTNSFSIQPTELGGNIKY